MAFGLLSVAGVSDVVGGYCVLYTRALSVFLVKEELLPPPLTLLPPFSFLLLSLMQMDGLIARHYPSQSSMLGSVLDPLADKCLVSILCITLTMQGLIPCQMISNTFQI